LFSIFSCDEDAVGVPGWGIGGALLMGSSQVIIQKAWLLTIVV